MPVLGKEVIPPNLTSLLTLTLHYNHDMVKRADKPLKKGPSNVKSDHSMMARKSRIKAPRSSIGVFNGAQWVLLSLDFFNGHF